MKIDATVKKETTYILYGVLFFTAVLQLIFLLLDGFSLFGFRYTWVTPVASLWTDAVMLLDFFLLGMKLQTLIRTASPDDPALQMKVRASASSRFFLKLALLGVGIWLVYWKLTDHSVPDLAALLLPVFFPRLTIGIRTALLRAHEKKGEK